MAAKKICQKLQNWTSAPATFCCAGRIRQLAHHLVELGLPQHLSQAGAGWRSSMWSSSQIAVGGMHTTSVMPLFITPTCSTAQKHGPDSGIKAPETIYFIGKVAARRGVEPLFSG